MHFKLWPMVVRVGDLQKGHRMFLYDLGRVRKDISSATDDMWKSLRAASSGGKAEDLTESLRKLQDLVGLERYLVNRRDIHLDEMSRLAMYLEYILNERFVSDGSGLLAYITDGVGQNVWRKVISYKNGVVTMVGDDGEIVSSPEYIVAFVPIFEYGAGVKKAPAGTKVELGNFTRNYRDLVLDGGYVEMGEDGEWSVVKTNDFAGDNDSPCETGNILRWGKECEPRWWWANNARADGKRPVDAPLPSDVWFVEHLAIAIAKVRNSYIDILREVKKHWVYQDERLSNIEELIREQQDGYVSNVEEEFADFVEDLEAEKSLTLRRERCIDTMRKLSLRMATLLGFHPSTWPECGFFRSGVGGTLNSHDYSGATIENGEGSIISLPITDVGFIPPVLGIGFPVGDAPDGTIVAIVTDAIYYEPAEPGESEAFWVKASDGVWENYHRRGLPPLSDEGLEELATSRRSAIEVYRWGEDGGKCKHL